MSESPQEWILKRRHEDLGVTVRMCWDLYIKFYTVFLTFSVVGLGWVLTRPGDIQMLPRAKQVNCVCLCDPDTANRDNKCGNRTLHSTCGAGPGAHRGSPDSIASWHTAFHQAGGTRVFSSVGWLVQLRSNACHGRLVALRRVCSLGRSLGVASNL